MNVSHDQRYTNLAKIGFEAYGKSTGGLTWDGKPIPPWEDVAWIAAARAIQHASVPRG